MRSRWFGSIAAGVVLLLAGCSNGGDYASQTAQALQRQVLGIATSANARNYAAAMQQLTQLEQADNAALAAGTITQARHDAILATIIQVGADLRTLEAAAHPTVTPTPQPGHHKKDRHGSDNGNGNGGD